MTRDYQYNYSQLKPSVFDTDLRRKKAATILAVCRDFLRTEQLDGLKLLDVGSSSGIIDDYLADYFGEVSGIDIDEPAMAFAREQFDKPNLSFNQGDAMQLHAADNSYDVVLCCHVYEHVPDARLLFKEIYRVLKPGGFCYFSGNNRVMWMEPHYRLPLLSLLPRPLAHLYMRAFGKGRYYHEQHLSYGALKKIVRDFKLVDYSARIIAEPEKFAASYMLQTNTLKWRLANWVANYAKWATPHIWILAKE